MSASHARRRRWAQRHDDLARLLALALIERGVKRRQKLNRQVELGFELFSRSVRKQGGSDLVCAGINPGEFP